MSAPQVSQMAQGLLRFGNASTAADAYYFHATPLH
jgi:hypothetical protein